MSLSIQIILPFLFNFANLELVFTFTMTVDQKLTDSNFQPELRSGISTAFDSSIPNPDIIKALPTAVYTCDNSGHLTFYNEAAVLLWGRRPEPGIDLWCGSWKQLNVDGSPLDHKDSPLALTLKNGVAEKVTEIIIERPDGLKKNILAHPDLIIDTSGKIIGGINLLEDISETLKQDNRIDALKVSEQRYHKMIEEVQDYAILLLDINGNILNWNRGAEKIKGYKEAEILGKNFRIFYLEDDRQSQLPEKLIHEAIEKGKAMHEGWRMRKDGTKFWGSIIITSLHDNFQNVIGFSKVTRDLTEKKLADDQLKQYTKDIEFRNSQLEEYAYIASHDLQEPLRKIQTFSELLEINLENKEAAKRFLDKISSSSKRMTTLIKDVLKYSQLSASSELFVEVDLNAILENVKEDFELLLEQTKGKINYTSLPVIKGISIQLHQLFSNLVGNSLKFCDQSPVIEITNEIILTPDRLRYPQLHPEHAYLKINFSDNGPGFESQYNEQVFKLFNRLQQTKPGTGIGLALCKRIVENHHGVITAVSELNKGTQFYIFLPISRVHPVIEG